MAAKMESPDYQADSTGSIIQEYSERITQALHTEASNLKKRAEQESNRIINQAKEESGAIIEAAQQEARQLLDAAGKRAAACTDVMEQTQKEAVQLLGEVDELVARVKQKIEVDLVNIIGRLKQDTEIASGAAISAMAPDADIPKEKGPIIGEPVSAAMEPDEHDAVQEMNEIADDLAESRKRLERGTAELVPQPVNSACGAGENAPEMDIPAGFERLTSVAAEAEKKWQMLTETLGIEAVAGARQTTEKTFKAVSVSQKTEVTVHAIEQEERTQYKAADASRLFKGSLNLEIAPPIDPLKLKDVQAQLCRIPGLKVLSTGGYTRKDDWVATYIVDLKQKMPLLDSLRAIPSIGDAIEYSGKIIITMR